MKDLKSFKFEPESLSAYTEASALYNTTSVMQQIAHVAQVSQAISMKRIADALETIAGGNDALHNSIYNAIATALMEDRQRR